MKLRCTAPSNPLCDRLLQIFCGSLAVDCEIQYLPASLKHCEKEVYLCKIDEHEGKWQIIIPGF